MNPLGGFDLGAFVLPLLAFLAVACFAFSILSLVLDLLLRDRSRSSDRVDEEFRRGKQAQVRQSPLFRSIGRQLAEAAFDQGKPSFRQQFEKMVGQSGLNLTPRSLLAIALGAGLVLGLGAGWLRKNVLVGAVAGLVGASAPVLYVWSRRNARLEKMAAQLPGAFDFITRVLRAGQSLPQALQLAADELQPPLAIEFAYCSEQQNLGLPLDRILKDWAERTNLLELKVFALATTVQQETGGNLAELLDKLAAIMRERFRLRAKIRALTAEGRMQALILMALPPLTFLLILLVHASYGQILLNYPKLLGTIVLSQLIGALWIRSIVKFDF